MSPPQESQESPPLARARDHVGEVVSVWDFTELMADLDPDDHEALAKFFGRKRIAQIIQAGLLAEKVINTKVGPQVVRDDAARLSWTRLGREIYLDDRKEKERMRLHEDREARAMAARGIAPAKQTEADFFAGLKGKPAVIRRLIDRLQGMLAEEERH